MPQMAPLMWTTLFILFITLLLAVAMKINFNNKSHLILMSDSETHKTKNLSWKW